MPVAEVAAPDTGVGVGIGVAVGDGVGVAVGDTVGDGVGVTFGVKLGVGEGGGVGHATSIRVRDDRTDMVPHPLGLGFGTILVDIASGSGAARTGSTGWSGSEASRCRLPFPNRVGCAC